MKRGWFSYAHAPLIVLLLILLSWPAGAAAKEITIMERQENLRLAVCNTVDIRHHQYIAVADLAEALELRLTFDKPSKKLTLQSGQNTLAVFAMNPFVVFNDRTMQMPLPTAYLSGQIYAPFVYFLLILKEVLPYGFEYDTAQNILWVTRTNANILGLSITEKQNGTLIRIALDKPVNARNIYTSESQGWLYIDLYGGSVPGIDQLTVTENSSAIDELAAMQLSKDTARLGFALSKKVKDKQIETRQNPPEVIIALRTHEEVPAALLTQLQREREKWRIDLIIIDAGHGGKDPGAIGVNGLQEKEVTLKIAREIKRQIEADLKLKVVVTRDRDEFIALEKRTEIANQKGGKLFLSIHADSNPNHGVRGHTVYFMGPAKTEEARRVAQFENSVIQLEDSQDKYAGLSDASFILAANAQNSFNKESEEFAAILDREMKGRETEEGLGVRQAGFYVLYGASMPNVLLETAFLSNKHDEKLLKNKDFHRGVADAVVNSIKEFKGRYESAF
jgi:N-acetylmuramoyl-L-alanine amidase